MFYWNMNTIIENNWNDSKENMYWMSLEQSFSTFLVGFFSQWSKCLETGKFESLFKVFNSKFFTVREWIYPFHFGNLNSFCCRYSCSTASDSSNTNEMLSHWQKRDAAPLCCNKYKCRKQEQHQRQWP